MNILHNQHNYNEPSLFRQILSRAWTPSSQSTSPFFPTFPITASSAHLTSDRYVNQSNLAGLIANSTFAGLIATSPIFESPGGAADQETTSHMEIPSSASLNRQFVSENINLRSHKPRQLMDCLLDQDMNNSERDFVLLNSPRCAQTQANTRRSNNPSWSLDDMSDNLGSLKLNEQKPARHIGLPSLRASFHRSTLLPQIWRKDIVFGAVIGKGGFGKVHTGHIHGRPVAIKVVQKRRGSGIHREILQAERLAFSLHLRHDNIISILGLNLCDGLRGDALIVMELVSPRTLQSVLDDNSYVVTQDDRLQFALQITKALHYLHKNDVVHLDVKPRNVLMTNDNTCKLGDFGSLTRTRKDVPREETEFTQLLGTLPYRAPELMRGCFPSNKADIFSLGITFWQLATRETPHCGANPHWLIYQVTKVNKRPDHHYTGNDVIEVKYSDLYTSCWDAEPERRPSAEVVIEALMSFQL